MIDCILIINNVDDISKQPTLRLLEEVKDTVDEIVTRVVSNYGSENVPLHYGNCSIVLSGTTKIRSFLHLAVKLQITAYVSIHVNDVQEPNRVNTLSHLLPAALIEYRCKFKKVKFAVFTHPSLPIVEILLQHGATLEGSDTWA